MNTKNNNNKKKKGIGVPVAIVGLSTIFAMGMGNYIAGADEFDVIHNSTEDVAENKDELPKIRYLVVGGEPRDIEYDIKGTEDSVSYVFNTSDEKYELEDAKDVTSDTLDVVYSEVSDEFKVNSLLDYGNIALNGEGNFLPTSKELIELEVDSKVTEHIAEYDEETKTYKIIDPRYGAIPNDVLAENDNMALITFVNNIVIPEDIEEEETEDTKTEEKETKEVEDGDDKEVEVEEEVNTDEVDISGTAGKQTFIGGVLEIGILKGEDGEEDATAIFGSPFQLEKLQADVGKSLAETTIYSENNIKTPQDLYDTFGIYNIPEEFDLLYREELDTNKDGVMGDVKGKPLMQGFIVGKAPKEGDETEVDDTPGQAGLGGINEDTIDESQSTPEDFDIEEDLPEDWEDGSQEVAPEDDDNSGGIEGEDVWGDNLPTLSDPESELEVEVDKDGNIVIVGDPEDDKEVVEEETDDTIESEEEADKLKEEQDKVINAEDEVIDDGTEIVEGITEEGKFENEEDFDNTEVVDEPEVEENVDETAKAEEQESIGTEEDVVIGSDLVIDDEDSNDAEDNEDTNDNTIIEDVESDTDIILGDTEDTEGTDSVVTEDTEDTETEDNSNQDDNQEPENEVIDDVIDGENVVDDSNDSNTENDTDEIVGGIKDENVGTVGGDATQNTENNNKGEQEPTIEESNVEGVETGTVEIEDETFNIELDEDGNIVKVTDGKGNVILDTTKGVFGGQELELIDTEGIGELKTAEDIESAIISKGVVLTPNSEGSLDSEEELSESEIKELMDKGLEKETEDELPDTGISSTGYLIPIGFTLMVLGSVAIYVSRRRRV